MQLTKYINNIDIAHFNSLFWDRLLRSSRYGLVGFNSPYTQTHIFFFKPKRMAFNTKLDMPVLERRKTQHLHDEIILEISNLTEYELPIDIEWTLIIKNNVIKTERYEEQIDASSKLNKSIGFVSYINKEHKLKTLDYENEKYSCQIRIHIKANVHLWFEKYVTDSESLWFYIPSEFRFSRRTD